MAFWAHFTQTGHEICPIFAMETAIMFYYYNYPMYMLAKIWFGQFSSFSGGHVVQKWAENVKKVDSAFKNGPNVKVYTSLEPYGRVLSFVDNFFWPVLVPHFLGAKPPLFVKKMSKKLISH